MERPLPTLLRSRGAPDRIAVVFSDIEMGSGGRYDDFVRTDYLAEVIRSYGREPFRRLDIDFVFNGDTFDFLKMNTGGGWPTFVTREVALQKVQRTANAHPDFFSALRDHLREAPDKRRVFFIVGNHDTELLFPEVQAALRARIGSPECIHFPGLGLSLGRLRVEHGSQFDPLFFLEPEEPFAQSLEGAPILALSWAQVALLETVIPLQPLLYHHDRLKPKDLVLKLIPEVKELLTAELWTYWTRRYFQDLWSGDPLKKVSWTMVKEIVRRTATWDVDVEMGDELQKRIVESDQYDVYLVGHRHEPGWWSHGHRKVLRTGCIRDEFMLEDSGNVQTAINKSWAEVYFAGERVVRSHLVEQVAPERPRDTMPESIFEVAEEVRKRLAESSDERGADSKARAAQEETERGG